MTTQVANLIDFRPDEGISRVHRSMFSDPGLFELEMKHLFEGGWVFLALESQVAEPNSFFTTRIGRQPIILMRDSKGGLGAFYNSCPHRGARICNLRAGKAAIHVCPYHSWSFDSAGRNRAIKGLAKGAYAEPFLDADHGLHPVARFANYRGLLFVSLSAEVGSLEDYLGDAKRAIDLMVDQSDEGLELVPGAVTYSYRANWKQQLENCADAYHVTSTHPTYFRVAEKRAAEDRSANKGAWDSWMESVVPIESAVDRMTGGTYGYDNGHVLNWGLAPASPGHPLFERREEIETRFGRARAAWMFGTRNLTIFPNVQFAQNFSSQLRIMVPIAPGLTEMQTYCFAPKGESAEARRIRIRQYEDFFNPTGLATPDDNSVYEDCQEGHLIGGEQGWLQGYARGVTKRQAGGGTVGADAGMDPQWTVEGEVELSDETVFQNYYAAWAERIGPALQGGGAAMERENA